MSSKSDLRLDWCSHAAAKYAVEHWHYSRSLPPPPHNAVGVWERGRFIGAVVFARGANRHLGAPFGLSGVEVAELVRVALTEHSSAVSRIVAVALRMIHTRNAGLRLIVSYADPAEGHDGGIYKAGGWVYAGCTPPSVAYVDRTGRSWHPRMISSTGYKRVFGHRRRVLRPDDCTVVQLPGKHRYLMPLDAEMREQIAPLAKPYPRASRLESEAPGVQSGDEGAAMRPMRSTSIGVLNGSTK